MNDTNESMNLIELNFKFPKEEHEYLSLCANKKGITLNQMAVYFIIKGIHAYEDELDDKFMAGKRDDVKEKTSWLKMCQELGWDEFSIS